jgi:hypothetical protein
MTEMESTYNQILGRFSVRRYLQQTLQPSQLTRIEESISSAEALDLNNIFSCQLYKYDSQNKSSGAMGIYGRIFHAPYFLAPSITGDIKSLVDLGFRSQQIVLDLWQMGIGSCYIGCVHQQKRVINLLDLPKSTRVVSMVAFGFSAEDQSKYLYQKVSQAFTRSKQRLEYNELFLDGTISHFANLSKDNKDIIEAGRQSPSATNAQPWRFRINQEFFEISAVRKSISRLYDMDQEYTLHDVGICMANMSRAASALGSEIHWEFCPIAEHDPKKIISPVARYRITR